MFFCHYILSFYPNVSAKLCHAFLRSRVNFLLVCGQIFDNTKITKEIDLCPPRTVA